jgi:hypothetical protein
MREYVFNDGLCSTCKFSSQCIFRNESSDSIHFCEEYEQAEASQDIGRKKATGVMNTPAGHTGNNPGNLAGKTVLGLCSNCIHRETCSFPRPASGVWHCEEYQ